MSTFITKNPDHQKVADDWASELEKKHGLIFGHMCGGKKFKRGTKFLCNMCSGGRGEYNKSYDWHITEEEWLIQLLSQ